VRKDSVGDQKGAIADFRLLLERTRSKYGPTHERTADAMSNVAIALTSRGSYEEGLSLQKSAIEILKEKLGADHPRVLYSLGGLAMLYGKVGDLENARKSFQSVIDARVAIAAKNPKYVENAVALGGLYCNFAGFLNGIKAFDEAVDERNRAIDTLEQINSTSPNELGKQFLANSYMVRADTWAMLQQSEKATADADLAVVNATSPSQKDEAILYKARVTAISGDFKTMAALVSTVLASVDSRPDKDQLYYLAARAMALCAQPSSAIQNSNVAESRGELDECAERCFELLDQARQAGFFENDERAIGLAKEPDFESIRHVPEFISFCQEIGLEDASGATADDDK